MNNLIGISGFARAGKDTFCERCSDILLKYGLKSRQFSFANALKNELNDLLLDNIGISAFTEDNEEKKIIRPLLVTYGTEVRRKLNPACWIESISSKVEESLKEGYYVFISDVRFLNEASWIQDSGGLLFNIQRDGIGPANKDEQEQYNLFRSMVDYTISWPSFGYNHIQECDPYIYRLIDSKNPSKVRFPKQFLEIFANS
jgi:hypothetical protein